MQKLPIRTNHQTEMLDITNIVQEAVANGNIKDGICYVFVPHTTAAVTINENADPSVPKDILMELGKIVPSDDNYRHTEGNSDAHIKTSLVGSSETLLVADGKLVLGTWQSIFFCEFDGPRNRTFWVKVQSD